MFFPCLSSKWQDGFGLPIFALISLAIALGCDLVPRGS
jgi:hypothetical protein